MKKSNFHYVLGIAAFATAAIAAWFSVTGLGKLFAGAAISVMIMAAVLEFAKLVVASYVYRYWKKINFLAKTYLVIAIVILMTITSAGIYGYLSGAYSETSSKLQISNGEISLLDKKKEQFKQRIVNTEQNINKKNTRITSLNNLRTSQEVRLDSLYARKSYRQAKIVESQIKDADSEIKKLTKETDSLLNVVNGYNEDISKLDLDVTGKEADNLKGDTAPLQYIASLFGTNMDKVVNFFMFLLIFVCDPLAIMLVIATNRVILENSEKDEKIIEVPEVAKKIEPEPIPEPIKKIDEVVSYVSNDKGEFKPEKKEPVIDLAQKIILDDIKSQGISHNASYLKFLEVLFKNGDAKIGDVLPFYDAFLEQLAIANLIEIKYVTEENGMSKIQVLNNRDKEVRDFLTICNLFKITDMSGKDKKIIKDYQLSKDIISLLSK